MLTRRAIIRMFPGSAAAVLVDTVFRIFLAPPTSSPSIPDIERMRQWHQVNEQVDLEQLVRRYTTLDIVTKSMIHPERLRGRCPFCSTPWDSFIVYCDENLYGCEGCYAGDTSGEVVDFFSRIEHLSYREAIVRLRELLAAGILTSRHTARNG